MCNTIECSGPKLKTSTSKPPSGQLSFYLSKVNTVSTRKSWLIGG